MGGSKADLGGTETHLQLIFLPPFIWHNPGLTDHVGKQNLHLSEHKLPALSMQIPTTAAGKEDCKAGTAWPRTVNSRVAPVGLCLQLLPWQALPARALKRLHNNCLSLDNRALPYGKNRKGSSPKRPPSLPPRREHRPERDERLVELGVLKQ